jgi:hypothetical protein
MTWNNPQAVTQFMKEVVERWHIRKQHGVQHQGAGYHQNARLGNQRQVVPAK